MSLDSVEVLCPNCNFSMINGGGDYFTCECGEAVAFERVCESCGAVDSLIDVSGHPRTDYEKRLCCESCGAVFDE